MTTQKRPMTIQQIAHALTTMEKGKVQVNIAQMHEVLKCLKQLIRDDGGMDVLRALLR